MVGEVLPLNTAMMCNANSRNNGRANSRILDGGPLGFTMIVVMGLDSKGRLSSRIFLVLDPAPSKENINDGSEVGGT